MEAVVTYQCIKPQCPPACDGCNHAIPSNDTARQLIRRLLNEYANDGHGATYEDGDHPLVDEARAFLRSVAAAPPVVVPAAQHWHDLYRTECQKRKDEAARLGGQIEGLEEQMRAIGAYAHAHSTGPAMPDELWEVQAMAYESLLAPPAAAQGGGHG